MGRPSRDWQEGERCVNWREDGSGCSSKHRQRDNLCRSCYQKSRFRGIDPTALYSFPDPPPDPSPDDLTDADARAGRERQPGSLGSPPAPPVGADEPSARQSLRDRARAVFGVSSPSDTGGEAPPERPPRQTRESSPGGPRSRRARVPAAADFGDLFASVGGFLMRTGQYHATGMMLSFQSGASGQVVDDAVANTAVDRVVVQRVVKTRKSLESVVSVVAPPAIVMAIENDLHRQQRAQLAGAIVPSRAPILVPLLESAMRTAARVMVPAVKKVRKRLEDEAAALAELYPDAPPGSDPVQWLIDEMFPGIYDALARMAREPEHAGDRSSE